MPEILLTRKEVQQQLRLGKTSLVNLIKDGRLRAIQVQFGKGSKYLFTQEEIDRFIKDSLNPQVIVPKFPILEPKPPTKVNEPIQEIKNG